MAPRRPFHYLIDLSYRGGPFHGWQKQPGLPTLYREFEKALESIADITGEFSFMAASRTDSGVHARDQKVKLMLQRWVKPNTLASQIQKSLHHCLSLDAVYQTRIKFPLVSGVASKTYSYYFTQDKNLSENRGLTFFSDYLNFLKIENAIDLLEGRHNFDNFQKQFGEKDNPIREIFKIELSRNLGSKKNIHRLNFSGSGFLKHMVRHLVGALWNIGQNKKDLDDLLEALKGKKRIPIGFAAPAKGLWLEKIEFRAEVQKMIWGPLWLSQNQRRPTIELIEKDLS